MAAITQTVTVQVWHIGTVEDKFDEWPELVQWCAETDGMSCTMTAKADGGVHIQVEGRDYATAYPMLDSYVTFNGYAFETLANAEYSAKHGS